MKGIKLLTAILAVSVISTSVLLTGCVTTHSEIISQQNGVIKYQSRCGKHELTKEQNLAESIDDLLVTLKPPKYPKNAVRKGIEGYTKIEFDLSAAGEPVNIQVIEAYPSDIFNNAAVAAFSGWRYKAKASVCHSIQLDFNMS